MITPKTQNEIEIMKEGGKFLGIILFELLDLVKVGNTPLELDTHAQKRMKEVGGSPSFMTVTGYKWATCISVNDGVVHGIPTNIPFKAGDLVSVDVGLLYKGYHTDTSWSVYLPSQDQEKNQEVNAFLNAGKKALKEALIEVYAGNRIGAISKAISGVVEGSGYKIVIGLVGHGIGKKLHEFPQIPGVLTRPLEKTPVLLKNMTIAVEVIYSMSSSRFVNAPSNDGWSLVTQDGSLAGLFEATVLVGSRGPVILTQTQK